jgi:uncharacterized phage-associated protein
MLLRYEGLENAFRIRLSYEQPMTFLSAQKFSDFDWRKAVSAVSYLVERTNDTLYIIMKMMYLADKVHLNRYGRFIAGDWYVAMKKGPVPSQTYDLLTKLREGTSDNSAAVSSIRVLPDYQIQTIDRQNYDELSDSDIECLDEIINTYKRIGKWAIRDMSHDEVWEKSWTAKSFWSKRAPMPMDAIAEHVGGEDLIAHVRDPEPGSA